MKKFVSKIICAALIAVLAVSAFSAAYIVQVRQIIIPEKEYKVGDDVTITIKHKFYIPMYIGMDGLRTKEIVTGRQDMLCTTTIKAKVISIPFYVEAGDENAILFAAYPES